MTNPGARAEIRWPVSGCRHTPDHAGTGLAGVVLTTAACAFMGSLTETHGNWWLLWGIIAVATPPVQTKAWVHAVASRFETARGLALALRAVIPTPADLYKPSAAFSRA